MRQALEKVLVRTNGRGFYEITKEVERLLEKSQLQTGLLSLHVCHTSASLLVQENADPTVREDFERFFRRLVPDGDSLFLHTEEGEDDMPAHVRSALTATTLSIPFQEGALLLGTWQGIYLWEHRLRRHSRTIAIHLLGE